MARPAPNPVPNPVPPPRERRLAFASLGVSVLESLCRAHVSPEGPEEPSEAHSVVLVRRGVFRRTRAGEPLLADSNHVLFFNEGEPYRFSHPLPGGDDCTVLALEARTALELVARHSPGEATDADAPFRLGHGLSSPRLARLHYELLALLRRAAPLAVEDVLAEIVDEAVLVAYAAGRECAFSPGAARRRARELVEAAKLAVNERLESPPSLGELASRLSCSPFHLSRTFRRVAGVSLRSYAQRLRARAAAERLALGAGDLTGLALGLGYSDHSHFTHAFRREWGVPPSRFRAGRRQ